ncbi:MAG: hypothetical protein KAI47_24155, partial [Deltaproteobacteria bacterium]|nr:hypothetical protein [Deltaproteobacteria bacterium]
MRCSLVLAVVSVGLLGASACVVELPDRPKDGGKLLDGAVRDAISDAAGKDHKTVLPPGCGDGKLGDGETCDVAIAAGDTGMCPTACDDGLACTEDTLRNGGTCKASCDYPAITGCADGDGCCPGGCTADEDNDCSRDCGNSKIDDKETCDTGIAAGQAGACPMEADCNDGSSCTTDTLLNPETCGAQCSHTPIVACTNGDGCCPTGCTTKTDDDCSVTCGDGVKDEVEKCDTAIAKGQPGACPSPADCEDGKACTIDKLLNPGSCNAQCS